LATSGTGGETCQHPPSSSKLTINSPSNTQYPTAPPNLRSTSSRCSHVTVTHGVEKTSKPKKDSPVPLHASDMRPSSNSTLRPTRSHQPDHPADNCRSQRLQRNFPTPRIHKIDLETKWSKSSIHYPIEATYFTASPSGLLLARFDMQDIPAFMCLIGHGCAARMKERRPTVMHAARLVRLCMCQCARAHSSHLRNILCAIIQAHYVSASSQ
jgi:hypothetical protein